jgi:HK97 family phage portal protein
MKKPSIIQRFKAATTAFNLPSLVNPLSLRGIPNTLINLNQGLTIYPYGQDKTFIKQGYNKNWALHVVIKKLVRTFSQIDWYHYKIKTNERKTYRDEYLPLTKHAIYDAKARVEMVKLLKKSVDQVAVDSDISRFLKKPNRNETGSKYRGNLFGHKLLTGEGNQWLIRPDVNAKPIEMFVLPKANLALVKGNSPWTIESYKALIGGNQIPIDKANMIMWIEQGWGLDEVTLNHLRGQSALDAWILTMQGMNEGAEKLANMNKNQGASGFAWNKADDREWSPEQAVFNRRQFNSIINDSDLAGTIAYFNGDWGFQQIGLDARALQLLEQQDKGLETVAMLYDVPIGMFKHGTTYENKPQEAKDLVYNAILPEAIELRDQWNENLLPQFNLDRDRDVIDFDIMSLPQLSEDLKTQAETLSKLWQLTPNQVLEYIGYDKSTDPNMDRIYIPSGYQTLDDLNAPVGGSLDGEVNLLNQ